MSFKGPQNQINDDELVFSKRTFIDMLQKEMESTKSLQDSDILNECRNAMNLGSKALAKDIVLAVMVRGNKEIQEKLINRFLGRMKPGVEVSISSRDPQELLYLKVKNKSMRDEIVKELKFLARFKKDYEFSNRLVELSLQNLEEESKKLEKPVEQTATQYPQQQQPVVEQQQPVIKIENNELLLTKEALKKMLMDDVSPELRGYLTVQPTGADEILKAVENPRAETWVFPDSHRVNEMFKNQNYDKYKEIMPKLAAIWVDYVNKGITASVTFDGDIVRLQFSNEEMKNKFKSSLMAGRDKRHEKNFNESEQALKNKIPGYEKGKIDINPSRPKPIAYKHVTKTQEKDEPIMTVTTQMSALARTLATFKVQREYNNAQVDKNWLGKLVNFQKVSRTKEIEAVQYFIDEASRKFASDPDPTKVIEDLKENLKAFDDGLREEWQLLGASKLQKVVQELIKEVDEGLGVKRDIESVEAKDETKIKSRHLTIKTVPKK